MQKKQEPLDVQYLICAQVDQIPKLNSLKTKPANQMKRRKKIYISGQVIKLQRLKNYIKTVSEYRDIPFNLQELKPFNIPQSVITHLNQNQVLKSSQLRYQRMLRTSIVKKNWSNEDLIVLVWLICKYSQTQAIPLAQIHSHKKCWQFISSMMVGITTEQCLFRWMSFKKVRVTQFGWDQQEEKLLRLLQKKYRNNQNKWNMISKDLYNLNPNKEKIYRQPKQCREHFNSFLDPVIKKGLWSRQEDYMLFSAYLKFNCQRRWCQINKFFQNRTQNSLKNRFQLLYSRIISDRSIDKNEEVKIIKKYTDSLRIQLKRLNLQDKMIETADILRNQALQNNFNLPTNFSKHTYSIESNEHYLDQLEQFIKNTKNQQAEKHQEEDCSNQSSQQQQSLYQNKSQRQSLSQILQEQPDITIKSQTSARSNTLQSNQLNIVIPQAIYNNRLFKIPFLTFDTWNRNQIINTPSINSLPQMNFDQTYFQNLALLTQTLYGSSSYLSFNYDNKI